MEVGERYIIEISDVIATNNGNIAKIKGFNALVFDENGLDKLERLSTDYIDRGKAEAEKSDACAEAQLSGRAMGHDEGYKEGYDEAKKVWYKLGYDEGKADALRGYEDLKEPEDHEPQEGDVYKSIKSDDKILITYNDCGMYTIIDSDGNSHYYDAVELEKYYEYFGHRADLVDTLKGALS